MRHSILLVALAFVIALCALPAMAQSLPPGSYQQTCTDIGMNGSTLYARCQDVNGNWQSTSLPNIQNCTGEIVNNNGSLQCGRNGYYNRGYQGGYRDRDRDRDRDWDRDRDRQVYNGNYNGYGNYGYGNLPPGDYVQTCRNIQTNGNVLQAQCEKRNGGWRNSTLDVSQCTGPIANNNGRLVCGSGNGYGYYGYNGYPNSRYSNAPFGGSYVQTCRNISTDGNRLDAVCETRDGSWRRTSMDNAAGCNGYIENDDGHLRCRR